MSDTPIPVTSVEFEKVVLQADVPVIVDFWATWCAPCRMIAPVLEKVAKEQAGKLLVVKVDVDKDPDPAVAYDVRGIPTVLFFFKGKLIYRQVGALPEALLRQVVTEFLWTIDLGERTHDAKN